MCELCAPAGGWSRRRFLGGVAAASLPMLGVAPAWRATAGASVALEVMPRSAWAGEAQTPRQTPVEPDVRFLLVHHTVNANDYTETEVPDLLRNIFAFHTGVEKGWPDIAYNFIVDRFGRAWETRQGSLERTVAGDATGGNQGFDQKCAFLGDHTSAPPSEAATTTMTSLLAWLADRSGIDTRPGATTRFTSRGSNRHPAGTVVETATITGHRTMSLTSCPGEAGIVVVRDRLPAAVSARRAGVTPTATTSTTSTTAAPAITPATPTAPSTAPPPPSEMAVPTTAPDPVGSDDPFPLSLPAMGAAGAGAVVLGAVIARRARLG